jgi:hypothetical protein
MDSQQPYRTPAAADITCALAVGLPSLRLLQKTMLC